MIDFEDIRPAVNRSVLMLYRVFSIVSLYAVLIGVLVYAVGAAFYAASSTWVAPIILSPVDRDSLDLTQKLVVTQATLQNMELDVVKLRKQIVEAKVHRMSLVALKPELDAAILRESNHKLSTGPVLDSLDAQKVQDNTETAGVMVKLAALDKTIEQELSAGLITKTDAIQVKAQLAKSNADLTDSRIGALLLRDNIFEKSAPSTMFLDVVGKRTELISAISTLSINISMTQQQIDAEVSQITHMRQAIDVAKQSVLYSTMQGTKVNVALTPYDNQSVAVIDAPVYDCRLSFMLCREVGTVESVYSGEQHATHPIFRTDLRGFLVQLKLSNPESAKSKTLFVGGKPLWF